MPSCVRGGFLFTHESHLGARPRGLFATLKHPQTLIKGGHRSCFCTSTKVGIFSELAAVFNFVCRFLSHNSIEWRLNFWVGNCRKVTMIVGYDRLGLGLWSLSITSNHGEGRMRDLDRWAMMVGPWYIRVEGLRWRDCDGGSKTGAVKRGGGGDDFLLHQERDVVVLWRSG